MPTEIHLIGEYHHDLLKNKRYAAAIEKIKPDIISLETNEELMKEVLSAGEQAIRKEYGSKEEAIRRLGIERYSSLWDLLTGIGGWLSCAERNNIPVSYVDASKELNDRLSSHFNSLCNTVDADALAKNRDSWKEMFSSPQPYEIAILKTIGQMRVARYVLDGVPPEVAFISRLFEAVLNNDENLRFFIQREIDIWYYTEVDSELVEERLNLSSRDETIARKILSLEGRVMHCGGLNHIFGSHKNLYSLLQEKGVEVRRYKLIDFDDRSDHYRQEIS